MVRKADVLKMSAIISMNDDKPLVVEIEGKLQNSLFPARPVIKCFVIPPNLKVEKKLQRNRLLYAGWLANLPRFQGARPDQVQARPLAVGLFFSQDALA